MPDQPAAAPADQANGHATAYTERLSVPLWWWPIGLALTALMAAIIHAGIPALRIWLPYLALLPLPIWVLIWLGRVRVSVDTTGAEPELRVGRAHIPVRLISRAAAVPAAAKSAALGRQLDPAAFVQHRPWVGTMVLAVLDDPDDPAPYWLISTRRPERLLAALGRPAR